MQSAQKSEDMDPAVVAIAPKNRESLFGYQRIAKEVIASIEDRLEELMSRQSSEPRQVPYRREDLAIILLAPGKPQQAHV